MKRVLLIGMILGLAVCCSLKLFRDFYLKKVLYLSSIDRHVWVIPKSHDRFAVIYEFIVGVENLCSGRDVEVMKWDLGGKVVLLNNSMIDAEPYTKNLSDFSFIAQQFHESDELAGVQKMSNEYPAAWRKAFHLYKSAEELEAKGDLASAREKAKQSLELYDQVAISHPNFQPGMIKARRRAVSDAYARMMEIKPVSE